MNNYFRAIRLTFKHKTAIIVSVLCALGIGLLWGGNIGAVVYPIVDICLKNETFCDWVDRKLDENQNEIVLCNEKIALPDASPQQIRSAEKELSRLNYYEKVLQKISPFIKTYSPASPFGTLLVIICVAFVSSLLKAVLTVIHGIITSHIAESVALELRRKAFEKVVHYEVDYFNREGYYDVASRITMNAGGVACGMGVLYGSLVREPIKMFACLIGAAIISWRLLLITLILIPLTVFAMRWLTKSIHRTSKAGMEQGVHLLFRIDETFRSIKIVKAFVRERYEKIRFARTNRETYNKSMRSAKYSSLTNPMVEVLGLMMVFIGILTGAYLVMSGQTHILGIPMADKPITQTELLVFFALLAGAADPARKLSGIITQFVNGAAAADRVYKLIDREIPISDVKYSVHLPRLSRSLVYENISFEYIAGKPVLHSVSLEILFGETVAIVGPSGCGKSTLANMIPRFIDPVSGRLLWDGVPLQNSNSQDLRKQISLVTQDPILMTGTVADNIRYGKLSASREEIIKAARNANAHDFIVNELPNGYETEVGHAGSLLSGGQRQRIALARAFIRDPSLLLLDEATNQIDIYSEQAIHEALSQYIGSRTIIIITHRLPVLKLADKIVVMQNGRIEAIGSHTELLENCKFYSGLFEI
ncbi:MAG: ABC transporter ATP-binding protein/permease [Planctomycetaceae bacterium]|jgi:ATP-binding cassette subfamily B protein/subfamily B ATP-binding cassette protein MsbA|nr:ABC transporter ATP-binding protein/permease [Planctomycetaceae bacterium]